jgi:PAS domain S-box-containing protein
VLADSLERSVVVISGDGRRILASNHSFTLLSGYSRTELEELPFPTLLPGEAGENAMGEILLAWDSPETKLSDVPLRTRGATITHIDIEGRTIGPLGTALLLLCTPSIERVRQEELEKSREDQLETLTKLSSLLSGDEESPLLQALSLAKSLFSGTVIGLYKVSAFSPDYILEGPLPSEFPRSLPTSAIELLMPATLWSLGHRTEHELQKSARASGLTTLRTAPLGTAEAWIGVLVAGWRDVNQVPDHVEVWMQFIAQLCHSIIVQEMQDERLDNLSTDITKLRSEIGGQFSAVTDALIALDSNLNVVRANAAAAKTLGYPPEELSELPIQDVLVGDQDLQSIFLDALGHEREAEVSRFTLHQRDGTPFPAYMRVVPIRSESRSQLLVVLQDRSEQKAIEDQTEILAQRAILGEVTAILAHEVRNPINNISTGVQLVASRLGEDHPQHESLERLKAECDRLNQLLSDVLFFARPLQLKMEPMDLADTMGRFVSRWTPRFKQSNIKCHTEFAPDLPQASTDPRTFEQVILNLITNALQAMPEGGTISIGLAEVSTKQGQMVELKIADTGPGIPADIRDRIFDPFFTTKKEGTGLGLAISRRILTAHKGSITVESYPDAGTVFTIQVPVADSLN